MNLSQKAVCDLTSTAENVLSPFLRGTLSANSLRVGLLKCFVTPPALALMDLCMLKYLCPKRMLLAYPLSLTLNIPRVSFLKKQQVTLGFGGGGRRSVIEYKAISFGGGSHDKLKGKSKEAEVRHSVDAMHRTDTMDPIVHVLLNSPSTQLSYAGCPQVLRGAW